MNLNFKLEDINLDNCIEVIDEINAFKYAIEDKCNKLKIELGKSIINESKTVAIRDVEFCDLYRVDRDSLQGLFYSYIMDMGFDDYGSYDTLGEDKEWFENDTFMLRPYSWSDSDCSCGLYEKEDEFYDKHNKHKDLGFHSIDCYNCADRIVNFWYKPTNLKISWYKYPMRSTYANQEIGYDYLKAVLEDCKNSVLN